MTNTTVLYAIGKNDPGYLPDNPESVHVVHVDVSTDETARASAERIAVLLLSDMSDDNPYPDGADPADFFGPDDGEITGDIAFAELARAGADNAYSPSAGGAEILGDVTIGVLRAITTSTDYSYQVNWSDGAIVYWAMPAADSTECSAYVDGSDCVVCESVLDAK